MPTYRDRLRSLSVSDPTTANSHSSLRGAVTPKTIALARLAALVAIGGAGASFGEHTDAAISAGASPDEIVDVLVGVSVVVGAPRVVDAAPKVASALGYDLDES
ncbi:carboxymuconolactone decarboxylase family protein [Microbacterium sp. NPDC076911]|uniref:carboxymuconolactone decarboxylase family protein n=1 Tax=Microbacterium sp. NPDC076911 TaxID=3154958 RepID=UPI003429C7D4